MEKATSPKLNKTLSLNEIVNSVRESKLAEKFNVILVVVYVSAGGEGRRGDPELVAMRREAFGFPMRPARKTVNKVTEKYREAGINYVTLWFDCGGKLSEPKLWDPNNAFILVAGMQRVFRKLLGLPKIPNAYDFSRAQAKKEKAEREVQKAQQKAAAALERRGGLRNTRKRGNQLAVV